MVVCWVSGQTLRRISPQHRPTTPWTGGRSFSSVPVPFFVGPPARAVFALRAACAFLASVLKQLVRFGLRVGELPGQVRVERRLLQAVTPLQKHRIVQPEFVSQVLRRHALREAPKNHHNRRTVVSDAREDRTGEYIEDGAALVAAVAYHRGAPLRLFVRGLAVGQLVALWAAQALRMQKLYQEAVALLFVKQIVDWELEHGSKEGCQN
jgi:hypothetical protein